MFFNKSSKTNILLVNFHKAERKKKPQKKLLNKYEKSVLQKILVNQNNLKAKQGFLS